jgi:cytochrome c553
VPRNYRWLTPVLIAGLCVLNIILVAWSQSAPTNETSAQGSPPYWAYAINPPSVPNDTNEKPADVTPRRVPGSTASFTHAQINNFFGPPDWHPGGHPVMPEIVAVGRKPDVFACGYCHLPNGQGRPENSSLAGLPADYIVQQMSDFKNGLRKSSDPKDLPVATMISNETKANDQEILAAAQYFSGLKLTPWIRVVETETVPKTKVAGWMLVPVPDGGIEPIGERIIETPENVQQVEMRNDATGFVAYVPPGSVKRGEYLVSTGGADKTVACAKCHGADLRGLGNVPRIAGRSPSYIVRQLYDIQSGARSGAATQLMKPAVAKLSVKDMLEIAAYLASLQP